jgi:hypothetical protein
VIAGRDLTSAQYAIALLWYYRESQQYDERTASELATDLKEEGFPKPNVTRLHADLSRSPYTVRGGRKKSFQVAIRKLQALNDQYAEIASINRVAVTNHVLPAEWFKGTRPYLEQLVHQINGAYQFGFYDACAVLCRRLMESLLIETYVHQQRASDIQLNGKFVMLERLISTARTDKALTLGRNTPKTMDEIKSLGDTAAHDRTYITPQPDLDEVRVKYRRLISDLLSHAGIAPTN